MKKNIFVFQTSEKNFRSQIVKKNNKNMLPCLVHDIHTNGVTRSRVNTILFVQEVLSIFTGKRHYIKMGKTNLAIQQYVKGILSAVELTGLNNSRIRVNRFLLLVITGLASQKFLNIFFVIIFVKFSGGIYCEFRSFHNRLFFSQANIISAGGQKVFIPKDAV